jgi:membrane-associated phospholipid phosphatase
MQWNDAVLAATHMGNSVLLLSSALVLAVWLGLGAAWPVCLRWALAIGLAVLLVLASKVAFFGWGVGIEQIDFTGISGHAMLATAVLPAITVSVTMRASVRIDTVAVGLAFAVAVLVGLTRIELGVHSWSEVLSGWLVGLLVATVAVPAIRTMRVARSFRMSPWPLLAANIMLVVATAPRGGRGPETHGLVIKIALWMSGRSEPFSRAMLHGQAI